MVKDLDKNTDKSKNRNTFKRYVRRYIELLAVHAKMDMATLLRDTGFMIACVVSDLFSNVSAMSGVFLLAWKFGGIGGMNRFEVLFMLAYGNIVMGFLAMFGANNSLLPSRVIGRGQWEHMFIMPLPYSLQMSCGVYPFTASSTFISGVVIMCVAAANLGALPWWWIPLLIGNVIISVATVVAVSFLSGSLAFYAPVQCEEISDEVVQGLSQTSSFPLSGMPGYIRLPLLSVLPAGLLAWLPTMIILGKAPSFAGIYPLVFAVAISFTAAYFFRKGFRYYVKTGINRYHPGGFRN